MIKILRDVSKKYFKLKADNKSYLATLFLSSLFVSVISLAFPYIKSEIVAYITIGDFDTTYMYILLMFICYFGHDIVYHFNYTSYDNCFNYTTLTLQRKVLEKVSTFDDKFTSKLSKSYLVNTTSSDIRKVSKITDKLFDCINRYIKLISSLVILLAVDLKIGLIVLAMVLIYFYLYKIFNDKRNNHLKGQRKYQDRLIGLFEQVLDGNKEVKSFDMKEKLSYHYKGIEKGWEREYKKKRIYHDINMAGLPSMIYAVKIIVYLILITIVKFDISKLSFIILVVEYVDNVKSSVESVISKTNNLTGDVVSVDRVQSILSYNPKNTLKLGLNNNDDIYGNVDFQNVSFSYNDKQILRNVSFNIEKNNITAIVGQSGSGKSTILKLLLRLYKVDNGNISLDGCDIYDYTKEVYFSNVSVVNQKPFIFNMSIRENLDLVDNNVQNQIEACKRVGIHDFIMTLPDKYNTVLKEDATDISGGQKQLISIARTLLSKSEVILFDEVTSALDPNTTKHIITLIRKLKKDHTVILITHKPKVMKIADKIIVIDKGSVVGLGKHNKLIQSNKYYKRLQLS